MAEPIDELQSRLDTMLTDLKQDTHLVLIQAVTENTDLIRRITATLGKLVAEIGLLSARVAMLEADGDTPFPPNGESS
jgi:hypothetical protein